MTSEDKETPAACAATINTSGLAKPALFDDEGCRLDRWGQRGSEGPGEVGEDKEAPAADVAAINGHSACGSIGG